MDYMNKYQKELQALRPYDEIQSYSQEARDKGYAFISTAGHGYLVVPLEDINANKAVKHATYTGIHAYYLEEDCEAGAFLNEII